MPGDRWIEVDDLPAAADALVDLGARRVLLTTGRLDLPPLRRVRRAEGTHVLVRSIEPPDPLLLPSATVLLDRGPYTVEGETALLREHGVDAVVTKNSGGAATAAKLEAARACGVPVVMVRRPPQPSRPARGDGRRGARLARGGVIADHLHAPTSDRARDANRSLTSGREDPTLLGWDGVGDTGSVP